MPDFIKPDFKNEVRKRLARLSLEPTREAAIVEEMAQHLEQRFEELLAQGATASTAREAVLNELRSGARFEKELLQLEKQVSIEPAIPAGPGLGSRLSYLRKDLRHAFRTLRLNPGFAAIAILSLALGIGANTAIFQLLDAVTLRSLPVKSPDELALVRIPNAKGRSGHTTGSAPILSYPIWEQLRDHQEAFSGMATSFTTGLNLANGGRTRPARGLMVNGDYFNTLGVHPLLGRLFSAADDYRGCGMSNAVISYGFWQTQFGGSESVIGSKLTVEHLPVEIIGVTPQDFFGLEVGRSFDIALPLCSEPAIAGEGSLLDRRDGWWLVSFGRLKPGWSFARATAQLESISPAVFRATLPPTYRPDQAKEFLQWKMAAEPAGTGVSRLRRTYQDPLYMLLAIAGTVLLIACANLANLMFARANAREREIAVRLALGASRGRIVQQLLAESILLSCCGAVAGVVLAQALTRILISFFSTQFSSISLDLALDWRVLGFTAAVGILTCFIFGLMPALKSTGIPPMAAMKAGSRGLTAGRERFGMRRVLVVTQVALSMVLLVGAVLFVRSFQNLINVDAGFRQTEILAADLDFTQLNIPSGQRNQYKQQLADRLQAIPGVQSAVTADIVPISGNGWNEDVHFDNAGNDVHEIVNFSRVSAGYFGTLDIPLVEGRDFGPQDTLTAPAVAIVNQLFVHKVLKDQPPLGRIFNVDEGAGLPPSPYQIVGVVKNTKYSDLREDLFPIAYLACSQNKKPDTDASILIRSSLPPAALSNEVERAVAQVSPSILIQFSVFKTQIRDSLQRERLMASLSGFFGFLAALLATIGLYGVVSYMVVRRRSEIGIRMALGADRGSVLALIMRETAVLLGIGVAIGAGLSLLATRTASALLYGLKPYDPLTLVLAGLALTIVAVGASYLPAFRATHIQPTEALREE